MKLLALTLTITLHFSSPLGGAAGWHMDSWSFDATPQVAVPLNVSLFRSCDFTLPGVTFYAPYNECYVDGTSNQAAPANSAASWSHELHHYRQQMYLGPWFWVAYTGTLGRVFEPYDRWPTYHWISWQEAWMPSESVVPVQNYPMFRVSSDRGFQIFPGY